VIKTINAGVRRLPGTIDLEDTAAAFVPEGFGDIDRAAYLEAEIPAANGTYTARSLARMYAALIAPDGLDGRRLWSPETLARVTLEQNDRRDLVLGVRPCWQLGYHQPFPRRVMSPRAFGFFGMYGSGAWGDPDRQLAVAVVCRNATVSPLVRVGRRVVAAADRRPS
jgi:CubicO group peptidase (beta-lactamase class C family)